MYQLVVLSVLLSFCVSGYCQMFGDKDHIGYQFKIHEDEKNKVTGYGKIHPNPPLALGAGADWKNVNGHGAGIDLLNQPSTGMTGARVSGQVGLVNKPQDQVYAFESHSRTFNSKFDTLGSSNIAGLGYSHTSRDERTSVGAQGGATFFPGMKPQPSFNIGFNHRF